MPRRATSFNSNANNAIDREIDSKYDNVRKVADEIAAVVAVSGVVNSGAWNGILNDLSILKSLIFQQATAPTIPQGASDGDIWLDTTSNTLKVYREYPIGTGVYSWEPLLYVNNDVVDGGLW